MSTRSLGLAGMLAGAALALAAAAEAATVTVNWDFADLVNTTESASGSGYGNTRTFTSGGQSVRVTAWSRQLNGQQKFQDAQLGRWSGYGLGVCSHGASEGANCGSPEHQLDNENAFDFVLFEFLGGVIDPTGVMIETFSSNDLDASYFVSTGSLPIDLMNLTEADLTALGFDTRQEDGYSGSSSSRTVSIGGSTGATALLFGASESSAGNPDYFKIVSLSASVTTSPPSQTPPASPVNEPTTLGLLGVGLTSLAWMGLRRRRQQ